MKNILFALALICAFISTTQLSFACSECHCPKVTLKNKSQETFHHQSSKPADKKDIKEKTKEISDKKIKKQAVKY